MALFHLHYYATENIHLVVFCFGVFFLPIKESAQALLTITFTAHANESLVPKGSLKFGKFLKNLKTSCELERKPGDLAPHYCAQRSSLASK